MVTLHPLKSVNILRERYSEDTADVFFVDKETKERLPAHREVLKVASAVSFKMFSGDWKEKEENEIPAPEEYKWESFRAAIALLYGEEVEVEQDSTVDVYRVAHCYDLKDVVYALVQDIRKWDSGMAAPMIKLGVLIGELEIDRDQIQEELFQAVMPYLARNLAVITGESLAGLSYEEVLMIVQLEDIEISEVDLLSRLTQWIKDHPDLTIVQGEKLLSHIRFGIIPYEALIACEVGHKNLSLALQHYHRPTELLSENILQVAPRSCQIDISPVFPVAPNPPVFRQEGKSAYSPSSSTAVGMMYFGRQEVSFEGRIDAYSKESCLLVCELSTVFGDKDYYGRVQRHTGKVTVNLREKFNLNGQLVRFNYNQFRVTLNHTGAYFMLQSTDSLLSVYDRTRSISKPLELRFSGPFPWLLTFGLTHGLTPPAHSFTFTYPKSHA